MSDYISREALIDRLNNNLSACNHGTFSEMCYADAIETVKNLPAADVEPVRHGEWLRTEDDWSSLVTIQCSACGGEWCFEIDEDVQLLGYNYCPGCGCKMDLEDETNDN